MKGLQVLLVFAALAAVTAAATSATTAPESEPHVCVPGHWQGKSFTVVQKKHLAILAKSAVDVDNELAASAFVVFGGKHRHHPHCEFDLGRSDLTSDLEDPEEEYLQAASNVDEDLDSLARKKSGKGITKIIADYKEEKLYIIYHKKGCEGNVTFCKVKDFEHPMSLSDALCLPERARQGPSITIGGSLLVDMYFFKAKNAYVQVALADEGNIPVSVNAVKKCGNGAVSIKYFNITKEIDEGFFDIPSSCEGKANENMLNEDEDFKAILDDLEGSAIFEDPMSQLFAGADVDADEDENTVQSFVASIMDKVSSFWRGAPASVNAAYDMAEQKIAVFPVAAPKMFPEV